MNDTQLYLAVGVPIIANATMLTLALTIGFGMVNKRIDDLRATMDARFASIEARLEILTGKVAELTDRVTRLEERTERR